jgi:hypothetical protein
MGNLQAPGANPSDPRPFQRGSVEGVKNRLAVTVSLEWLVDTGANISVLTRSKAAPFDLTPLGGSATGTTGGGGILIVAGLAMVFTVLGPAGANRQVRCSLPVGVKPNDTGSNLLGMDQLALAKAKVRWDPSTLEGDIYE